MLLFSVRCAFEIEGRTLFFERLVVDLVVVLALPWFAIAAPIIAPIRPFTKSSLAAAGDAIVEQNSITVMLFRIN